MRRIGHLFERIVSFENLSVAFWRAAKGKKSKGSVARYVVDFEKELLTLRAELTDGTYQPRPYFQFKVFEPKERNICCSDFRDRVVHHAICAVVDPFFERRLIGDTFACRKGRGSHRALRRCQEFSRRHGYFLKCDISKYFESIDHAVLKRLLSRMFKDRRLEELFSTIIEHEVPGAQPGRGVPIGNLTSQHFANLYLGELDHFVKEKLRVPGYLRYMDDFVLFHGSKALLGEALEEVRDFVDSNLSLRLKEKVTRLAPVSEGVAFLGFRIFPQLVRVQRANLIRMRRKLVRKEAELVRGKISEEELFQSINSVLAHVSHADSRQLLRKEVIRSLKLG